MLENPSEQIWRMRGPSIRSIKVWVAILLGMVLTLSWGLTGFGAPATIQLTAREWRYEPKEASSSSGDVVFNVRNGGLIEHNFVLEDQAHNKRAEIPYIEPGETLQAIVNLPPGTYTIYCSLPGHRDAGMVATLHVK